MPCTMFRLQKEIKETGMPSSGIRSDSSVDAGPQEVLGILGEWLFIFRELGKHWYFQGFGEQAHSFRDLGSPAKKVKNKFKKSQL